MHTSKQASQEDHAQKPVITMKISLFLLFPSSHHAAELAFRYKRLQSIRVVYSGWWFSVDRSIPFLRVVATVISYRFLFFSLRPFDHFHTEWCVNASLLNAFVFMFAITIRIFSVSFWIFIVLTLMPLFAPYKCGATEQSTYAIRICIYVWFFFRLKKGETKTRFIQSVFILDMMLFIWTMLICRSRKVEKYHRARKQYACACCKV